MSDPADELLPYLAGEWTGVLAQILESMTDQKPQVNWEAVSAPPESAEMFWWAQCLSLGDAPLVWIGAPRPAWSQLGERTLRAAGIEAVAEADARNTYLEILSQSLSGLAQSLTTRLHSEVTCTGGEETAAPPATAWWTRVEVAYTDAGLPAISLGFSPRLIAGPEVEEVPSGATAAPPPVPQTAGAAPAAPSLPDLPHSRTLDLLLDVELPVSISFGRAELPLKDVLKLTTGSIVELNRGVSEPVEVIVNNCVVARGEVVVMDGNYGVRIHQIITPQERLRTLK
jgi:flagellar motor switch protein FliN